MAAESTARGAFYRCHGLAFCSEIPLPFRAASGTGFPEWRITCDLNRPPIDGEICWVEPDPEEARPPWLLYGHSPAGIHIEFPNLARFLVRPDARRILVTPKPGVPESTLGHLLMNQVIPLVLANQGHLMLHASAVEMDRGVVAFLGDSGAGKTTVATALALRGRPLVSEDVVRLELTPANVLCHPCPSPPRLWADSFDTLLPGKRGSAEPVAHYTSKRRMTIDQENSIQLTERPIQLEALVLLDSGTDLPIDLKPVEPRHAFEKTISALFRVKPSSTDQIRREFDWATSLARRIPFHRLCYSRDFTCLPAVLDLLSRLPSRDNRKIDSEARGNP